MKLKAFLVVVVAIMALAQPALLAQSAAERPAATETAEGRYIAWMEAFDTFLERNSDLSRAELAAVSRGTQGVSIDYFDAHPTSAQKAFLAERLNEIKQLLPCGEYAEFLSGFGELGTWLRENELVAAGTCTCNSNAQCSSGYSCNSSACTSEEGSTNWGTCEGGGIEIEV